MVAFMSCEKTHEFSSFDLSVDDVILPSSDGESIEIECYNCDDIWIESVESYTKYPYPEGKRIEFDSWGATMYRYGIVDNFKYIAVDNFQVTTEGNMIFLNIGPADSNRKFYLELQSGDVFKTITVIQSKGFQ